MSVALLATDPDKRNALTWALSVALVGTYGGLALDEEEARVLRNARIIGTGQVLEYGQELQLARACALTNARAFAQHMPRESAEEIVREVAAARDYRPALPSAMLKQAQEKVGEKQAVHAAAWTVLGVWAYNLPGEDELARVLRAVLRRLQQDVADRALFVFGMI